MPFTVDVTTVPFNAAGDGVTDDTAAIQQAINDVSSIPGGGTVWIPQGIYLITETIHHLPNVIVRGTGYSSVIRKTGQTTAWTFTQQEVTQQGVRAQLCDLYIESMSLVQHGESS